MLTHQCRSLQCDMRDKRKRKKRVHHAASASAHAQKEREHGNRVAALSTARGLLAMLKEQHPILKLHALNNLNVLVDLFWPEISTNISQIETLYEDEHFEQRQLAALVASKVFYHLGELNDSLAYALGAGPLFDVSENSEYVQTLIAKCVDEYISLTNGHEGGEEDVALDPRLAEIVDRMLDKCMEDGKFKQAVGIALECRRLDKLEDLIKRSGNPVTTLAYCLKLSQTFVNRKDFRHEVLRLLVDNFEKLQEPDYLSICQCLMLLDEPKQVANILMELLGSDETDVLLAYQIGFDLFENQNQRFLINVKDNFPRTPTSVPNGNGNLPSREEFSSGFPVSFSDLGPTARESTEGGVREEVSEVKTDEMGESSREAGSSPYAARLKKLKGILSGEIPLSLTLQFLHSHNRSDLTVLKSIKQSLEVRNSVCHSATIYSNALMHAGTTVDTFLRQNLDWLGRATNWAKFSATAGLGVIHRGHLQQGRSLLSPYLPQIGSTNPYSEGGALYALGLIYAGHGEGIKQFLLDSLRNAAHEVIQHGACLGLGLAGLGSADEEIYENMKAVLYTESAVAGEAAGIGMGLINVGAGFDKAGEMLAYAHDTQHEKITRGLALGIALMMYGREEEADPLIERMTRDQDPVLRYGGMYAFALAYRGTANNTAIRRLLHFAVSDVSDDVRRTAVISLGFVLSSEPTQTPRIVSLLSESYNAHIRYGVSLALGISCAGTDSNEAIAILEPLLNDPVDFVRQGALIGLAMVLLQTSEARDSRVGSFREQIQKIIADKRQETMSKMGAILAQGILDAGGRNVGIMLQSRSGHERLTAIVGMAVFCQFWYWYPLIYFLSLSFAPTAFIGLTEDLRMPKFEFVSEAKSSMFSYPPTLPPPIAVFSAKSPAASLSTAARGKARAAAKERLHDQKAGKMVMQEASSAYAPVQKAPRVHASAAGPSTINANAMAVQIQPDNLARPTAMPMQMESPEQSGARLKMRNENHMDIDTSAGKRVSTDAPVEILYNPSRVILAQEKYIKFRDGCRYVPLPMRRVTSGFVMLRDLAPSEPSEVVPEPRLSNVGASSNVSTSPRTAENDEPNPFLHS